MKEIYLLWMSFVECDCSILNLLIDRNDTLTWLANATRKTSKTRLHIFYKIINNKIAVPYDNILIPSQSRTRSTHSNTMIHSRSMFCTILNMFTYCLSSSSFTTENLQLDEGYFPAHAWYDNFFYFVINFICFCRGII
jgi:hypothetical protein